MLRHLSTVIVSKIFFWSRYVLKLKSFVMSNLSFFFVDFFQTRAALMKITYETVLYTTLLITDPINV